MKITVLRKFSYRSESSEPHVRVPRLGGLALGGGATRVFGL